MQIVRQQLIERCLEDLTLGKLWLLERWICCITRRQQLADMSLAALLEMSSTGQPQARAAFTHLAWFDENLKSAQKISTIQQIIQVFVTDDMALKMNVAYQDGHALHGDLCVLYISTISSLHFASFSLCLQVASIWRLSQALSQFALQTGRKMKRLDHAGPQP